MNTTQVPHVAVSGPACSGKSTLITNVVGVLRARGMAVLVAEEAASRLISDAVPDIAELDPSRYAAAQAAMLRHMRDQRLTLGRLAADIGADLVLHDRCELDAVPYDPDPGLEAVLAERGETVDVLAATYRAVLFCDQAPVYETGSNPQRYEDETLAASRAAGLLAAYAERMAVHRVPWRDSPTDRCTEAVDLVVDLIGARR